jgi:hypothetical protein
LVLENVGPVHHGRMGQGFHGGDADKGGQIQIADIDLVPVPVILTRWVWLKII